MRMPNWAGTLERLPIQGFLVVGLLLLAAPIAGFGAGFGVYPFGNNGKLKMLYDARQRPQSVLLHGRLHIVFNADARPTKNLRASAVPMGVTFDLEGRTFSDPVALGPRHTDHHFSPIIWADERDHLHVLHGCHRTPGQHLVSVEPVRNGSLRIQWEVMGDIAPKLSYPTVYRISGNREIIYYRTDGHTSSWTYRISDDNGRTWVGPTQDVTDLDAGGRLDWSSYQTKIPSRDGRFLHVVYTDYDDNKHRPDPKRFFNPRYRREVDNEWKYNLSYFKIDLESQRVSNAANQAVQTPIDFDRSEKHCQIWDTQWRGAGVPPAIALSPGGEPSFLHVLSEDTIQSHRYYYVAREGGGGFRRLFAGRATSGIAGICATTTMAAFMRLWWRVSTTSTGATWIAMAEGALKSGCPGIGGGAGASGEPCHRMENALRGGGSTMFNRCFIRTGRKSGACCFSTVGGMPTLQRRRHSSSSTRRHRVPGDWPVFPLPAGAIGWCQRLPLPPAPFLPPG